MKNYDEMTDDEIDSLIRDVYFSGFENNIGFRPCSNPSDAWPIIAMCGISIDFWGDYWSADIQHEGEVGYEYEDKKPLRAAMICYLKMKDDE